MLDREGVPRSWYALPGDEPGFEATCLENVDGAWEVYFDERGKRIVLGRYETEDEACQFVAADMLKPLSEHSPSPDHRTKGAT